MSKTINITRLDEGFIVKDLETNQEYAVTKERMIQKVKTLLSITAKKKPELKEPSEPITTITETGLVLKEITFPDKLTDLQEHKQGKMTWYTSKDRTAIRILREGYDTSVELSVTDLKYLYDNPTPAKEIIKKFGIDNYQNKAVVLRGFLREIPYPMIFFEDLNEEGSEDGTCDDITFDNCANNKPENCKFCVNQSRFEDKKKLAAKRPGPPHMKANMVV